MTSQEKVTAVVPVKPWRLSKSRLHVGQGARERLARAFSLDVVDALNDSSRVDHIVLVTAELDLIGLRQGPRKTFLSDRPMLTRDGLNVAIRTGRSWGVAYRPTAPIVVVPADLPALTAEVFDSTIDLMQGHEQSFVPDSTGHGTTLLWACCPRRLAPEYGPGSAARHARQGAHIIHDADSRVRRDVDSAADLLEARHLGTGKHTSGAAEQLAPFNSQTV